MRRERRLLRLWLNLASVEFPQSTNPAGVPRSAVEAAYQSKVGEDIGKGATFTTIYAAALVPNGVVLNPTQVS